MRRTRVRRKHRRVDPAKLEKAKRAATDTRALHGDPTLFSSEGEIDRTLRRLGGRGGVKKVFR